MCVMDRCSARIFGTVEERARRTLVTGLQRLMFAGAGGFGEAILGIRGEYRIPVGFDYLDIEYRRNIDREVLIGVDAQALYSHLIDMINQGQLAAWNIPPEIENALTQGRGFPAINRGSPLDAAIHHTLRGYLERLRLAYINANQAIQGDGASTADYHPDIPFGLVMRRQERTPLQFQVNELTNHALREIYFFLRDRLGPAAALPHYFTEGGLVERGDIGVGPLGLQGTRADGWHR